MKKITIYKLLLILSVIAVGKTGMAQVTKQQAIDFVMDSIVGNQKDTVNVYMESFLQNKPYYRLSSYDSIQSPYSDYWLFFIDKNPTVLWDHPCEYVFTDKQSGNTYILNYQSPPFNYNLILENISISYKYTPPLIDTLKTQMQSTYMENSHLYAVIFAIGSYWHGISHLFSTLKEKGFKQENIYVLLNDGNPNNQYILDMDLNSDGIDDIMENVVCNYNSLDSIFNILATKMTNEDLLLLYSMTHGVKTNNPNGLKLKLWDDSPILDSQLANFIDSIHYSQFIYFVLSCHSGGMVDNFNKPHQTIITCTNWDNSYIGSSYVKNKTGMSPFEYGTITALRGYHPKGEDEPWNRGDIIGECDTISNIIPYLTVDINPDSVINNGNNDYVYQLQEVCNYTKLTDKEFDTTGQFLYNLGFNEDLLSLTGISGEVDTTQTLQGNYLIGGKLSINSGVKLTLDTSSNFYVSGTNIVVKQGAVLSVDGGNITSTHDTIWQGIEVWGNTNAHQYTINDSCSQGQLFLKNNATLKNASNAVTLWEPDNWDSRGGIIIAKDSKFINNRRSVEFMSYQNHHPINGEETDYISSFTNCSFIYDDDYHASESMRNHVTMWGVRGVEFRGCSFINDISSEPNTGYGIYSLDAGYRIIDYCNAQIMPCPDSCITPSAFKGFEYGIKSANVNKPLNHISVFNSEFLNNGFGVHLSSTIGSVIVNSNFELGAIPDSCGNMLGTGIQLDNSKAFAVENNYFTLFNNSVEASYLGIRTINTNNAQDEIYKNTFDGLDLGNLAEGKNWAGRKDHGLAYYCNQNQNNDYDFDVERIVNTRYNDIQTVQGSNDYPAGNTFSVNASYNFYNNGDDTVTYYYKYGIAVQNPVSRYRIILDSLQLTNTCPSHYTGGDDIRLSNAEYQQRENDYDVASSSYYTATSNYNTANDLATRDYWAGKMSYYNTERARAAYDIIRSDLSDTIAHPDKFKTWMEKVNTCTSNEALADYYIQQGEYSKALNKVDSLPYYFTFTAYDSIEYPMYKDLKYMQVDWLSDGRNIFSLTNSEISNLIIIADSSKGTAGAQARAILQFAYPKQYAYINCVTLPGHGTKSAEVIGKIPSKNNSIAIVAKPNPANITVTFSYTLPENVETALLSIYNANGKLIYKQLLNARSKELRYNCSLLKTGVYYYSVSTTSETVTGKIIIVR